MTIDDETHRLIKGLVIAAMQSIAETSEAMGISPIKVANAVINDPRFDEKLTSKMVQEAIKVMKQSVRQ